GRGNVTGLFVATRRLGRRSDLRLATVAATGFFRIGIGRSLPARSRPPAFRDGLFGIDGRFDGMLLGPGKPLFGAKAAAMPPAFLGALAAAGVVLTGEGLAAILARQHGKSKARGGRQVGEESQSREELPRGRAIPGAARRWHGGSPGAFPFSKDST